MDMDLTQIPKELIYKDRRNLDDFGISINGSINKKLYSLIKNEICIYESKYYDQLILLTEGLTLCEHIK